MITQAEIAREVGLDTSSVCKILNRMKGVTFAESTIKRVFSVAKRGGYDFSKVRKGRNEAIVRKAFPMWMSAEEIARHLTLMGFSVDEVQDIKRMLYGERAAG